MNKIKNIVIISLVLLSGVLAFLLYRSINESCECPECKKEEPKSNLVVSQDYTKWSLPSYGERLEDGYEILGVATNHEEYEDLVLPFYPVTNCAKTIEDETNCIGSTPNIKDEHNYDKYVYIIAVIAISDCGGSANYQGHTINDDEILINVFEETSCGPCAVEFEFLEIGINEYDYNYQNIELNIEEEERDCDPDIAYKPIMYLYPTQDIDLSITFTNPSSLITPRIIIVASS